MQKCKDVKMSKRILRNRFLAPLKAGLEMTFLIVLIMAFMGGPALADQLMWDDPGAEWEKITGYTIYFTDGTNNYSKNVTTAELIRDTENSKIIYDDVEVKLNLPFNVEYSIYITAYNDAGESEPSNIINYARESYSPPPEALPSGEVVLLPKSPTGLEV